MKSSKNQLNINRFRNPNMKGFISFNVLVLTLLEYMNAVPGLRYVIGIGTDSQVYKENTDFVIAVYIHRVGNGGRYFWLKTRQKTIKERKPIQRIFNEALMSIDIANQLLKQMSRLSNAFDVFNYNLEVHVDVGHKGPTREILNQIVGMVRGSGFIVRCKPEAIGASTIADKYT